MLARGDFIESSALAMVLLSAIVAWMLTGMVTASDECIQETGYFFGNCMEEGYLTAGLPPTHDHKHGDEALSGLINEKTKVIEGCKAKWQVASCVIKNLCSAKKCTFKDAEMFEEQFKKELMPFVIPCKWDYKDLEVKRCTEDEWKKAHEEGSSTTEVVNNSSTTEDSFTTGVPFAVNSTSAAPIGTTEQQNSTATSSVRITTGNGTTGSGDHSTVASNSSEHSSTGNSFFEDLKHSEIIFIAICCLVIFLFCCIFCCCCCTSN